VFIVIVFIDDCVLIVFFLPAHYCYYSGLTVLNKDFIHSFITILVALLNTYNTNFAFKSFLIVAISLC